MNEASFRMLTELLDEPRALATIATEFESQSQGPDSEEYMDRMIAMLRRLEPFGLIERA